VKTLEEYLAGQTLLIDKPLKWSSFQAVNKVKLALKSRFQLRKLKVGHAGTLDPLASGLLVICIGKDTKKISTFQGQIKEYTGTFTLGSTTPSYDLETEINETFPTAHITEKLIYETGLDFFGEIDQVPPVFSALKKDGQRMYKLARAGEVIEVESRKVCIHEFEITRIELPEVDFRVACSKGTYIRSLAYDFGKALNSGAHLSALRRTKIGEFDVKNAITPDFFGDSLRVGTEN